MNDPQGTYKMRFKCDSNGSLLKGAPGNYVCGEIYRKAFRHSRFAFWELLEEVPVLIVPESTDEDGVFDESVFIADDAEEILVEMPVLTVELEDEPSTDTSDVSPISTYTPSHKLDDDARTKELAEQYRRQGMFLLDAKEGIFVPEQGEQEPEEKEEAKIIELSPIEGESHTAEFETLSVKVEPVEALDRDALKRVLDEAGVEYKPRARTATLQGLVDELATKE